MKKIFKKTTGLIFSQQGGMFSSALILSLMIVISRIFGFIRYRILAGYFSSSELDIFFASFRIPDLVFEILITGAFTSAFIPIFIRYQKNKKELAENISSIFNLIGFFFLILMVTGFFLMPIVLPMITPGFTDEKNQQIIFFSQILLISQLPYLILGNFLTGLSQAKKIFFATSLAPIFYNLFIILTTVFFTNDFGLHAPIIGVIIGAFFFFLIQLPIYLRLDYIYLPIIKISQGVKDFFRIIVPRLLTVIFTQIDATIDLTLSSLLGAGSYTIFYLAQHLQLLPVSVIGIAFGQASLPFLSELFEEKKIIELKKIIADSILNLFFFTFPIMGMFIFARTPIVRLFFGGQKFDWEATVSTAMTLSYFSFSLPFHSLYYFITRCFYALLDSKTPFIVGVISIIINTILSVLFTVYLRLPVWALAISFSISVIINVFILTFILSTRLNRLDEKFILIETLKITCATLISSIISYYLMHLLDGLIFDTSRTINVFFLLLTITFIHFSLYLFSAWLINVKEIYLISRMLLKLKGFHKSLTEIYTNYE